MLYAERLRLQELADREAAGQDVWTTELDEPVRRKLVYALKGSMGKAASDEVLKAIRGLVCQVLGLPHLVSSNFLDSADVETAILHGDGPLVFSVIEAGVWALNIDPAGYKTKPEAFEERVNRTFRDHRLAYELVEGRIVPFDSQELHTEVVAPTVRLLAGRSSWEPVEVAYQKALKEIGDDPSDAITDAGTALQGALTLLGCTGNALGPLVKDAKRKGILAPHDPALADAIAKVIDWVSADRSEKGDGHKSVTGATPEDAWFTVHVVGALILRLASGSSRGEPEGQA